MDHDPENDSSEELIIGLEPSSRHTSLTNAEVIIPWAFNIAWRYGCTVKLQMGPMRNIHNHYEFDPPSRVDEVLAYPPAAP